MLALYPPETSETEWESSEDENRLRGVRIEDEDGDKRARTDHIFKNIKVLPLDKLIAYITEYDCLWIRYYISYSLQ